MVIGLQPANCKSEVKKIWKMQGLMRKKRINSLG